MTRLLFITQAMDPAHSILGFVPSWVRAIAKRVPVTVICLRRGSETGVSVPVYSLGREHGVGRFRNIARFLRRIVAGRNSYDTVFVHMNQIYVLLGAPFWKLMGKRVFMWRNHPKGSWVTRLALMLSDGVFCTSRDSFTARYRKTLLAPVGIDTMLFAPHAVPKKWDVLVVCRISPAKHIDILIDALAELKRRGRVLTACIVGDPLPGSTYPAQLQVHTATTGLTGAVTWHPGVDAKKLPEIYSSGKVMVNLAPPGHFDKVILEAFSCGIPVIAINRDLQSHVDERCVLADPSPHGLADRLVGFLDMPDEERAAIGHAGRDFVVREHSLDALVSFLGTSMKF